MEGLYATMQVFGGKYKEGGIINEKNTRKIFTNRYSSNA